MKKIIIISALIFAITRCYSQITIQNVQIKGLNPIACVYGNSPTDSMLNVQQLDTTQIGTAYNNFTALCRTLTRQAINYIIVQNTVKQTKDTKYPQRFIVTFKNSAVIPKLFRVANLTIAQQAIYTAFISQCQSMITQ